MERTHLSVLHTAPLTCHFLERMDCNKDTQEYILCEKLKQTFQWKFYRGADLFFGFLSESVATQATWKPPLRENIIAKHSGEKPTQRGSTITPHSGEKPQIRGSTTTPHSGAKPRLRGSTMTPHSGEMPRLRGNTMTRRGPTEQFDK